MSRGLILVFENILRVNCTSVIKNNEIYNNNAASKLAIISADKSNDHKGA